VAADEEFEHQRLDLSFRSAPGVLQAIDKVFERPEAFQGLATEDRKTIHEAIRTRAPALVEIWPTETPDIEDEESVAWDAPLNARSESSPPVRLAENIARGIRHWFGGGLAIADGESGELRTPRAGDVIVLVRRRGPLFDAILQALKRAGVPVAGADRLTLTEHIAVMDLMALGDALSLEADNLALGCALKSPLFGLGEDDLFALAHGRTGTLAASLLDRANTDPRFRDAATKFDRWRREAAALRPFDFYSRVLGRDNGRHRFLARMGMEAADALDEFLTRALAYEDTETPSLTGFLSFLRRTGTDVKRDLEVTSDAVRVMTVHGAKGLEAPIIVLADTTSVPDGRHDAKLLALPDSDAFAWALGSKADSNRLAAARTAAGAIRAAEYRRLLYVALTRAADAIIVCGHESIRQSKSGPPEGCWYQLVHEALKEELVDAPAPGFEGTVGRWRPEYSKKLKPAAAQVAASIELPRWIGEKAPSAPPAPLRIMPSQFDPDDQPPRPYVAPAGTLDPRRRGILLHRLLQHLPDIPAQEREAAAASLLAAMASDVAAAEREVLTLESLRVVTHEDLAELFGPNSRAEVDVLAHIREPVAREIVGRIDRLAVTADKVIVADFKTGSPATDVPLNYVRQLAIYRDVLARVFPGRAMQALLVWTAGPAIHKIEEAQLKATLSTALTEIAPG
jgi:ATP-dependent helicase/nuclease subunit A